MEATAKMKAPTHITTIRIIGLILALALALGLIGLTRYVAPDQTKTLPRPTAPTSPRPGISASAAQPSQARTNLAWLGQATQPDANGAQDAALCNEIARLSAKPVSLKQQSALLELRIKAAELESIQILTRFTHSQNEMDKASAHYLLAQVYNSALHPTDEATGEKIQLPLAVQNINEIAKLALHSADPNLYALAFHGCNSFNLTESGVCAQINATQWVHRDPDNGTALLYLISEIAKMPKNTPKATLENALFRLSQAKKFDNRLSALALFQQQERTRLDNLFVQFEFMRRGQAAYTRFTLPAYKPVLNSCTPEAVADPNRRQVCDAIAHKLLSDDGMIISHGIGQALGKRLAWPEQKMAKLDEDVKALLELLRQVDAYSEPSKPADAVEKIALACHASFRATRAMEKSMELGEVAYAKQLLAQQQLSRAELAAKYRAYSKLAASQAASSAAK